MAMHRTKQQMQILILGIVAVAAVVFIIIQFVLVPLLNEWKRNTQLAREAQTKLEEYRDLIRNRSSIQMQIDAVHEKTRQAAAHIPLPVLGNYLLGMETQLRAWAQGLDVSFTSVTEQDISDLDGDMFKIYRVRVVALCGFHDLARFLRAVAVNNPWVSITGVTILPRQDHPEKHEVSIILSWLIWADPTKRPAFLMKSEPRENKTEKQGQ